MEIRELVGRYQTAMNTVYRSVHTILKERIDSEVSIEQFSTLQYIHTHKNCTSTEIAQTFAIGKSTVTAQVNRLFDKKLIERIRDNNDRRNVYLHLTDKGVELVNDTEEKLYAAIGEHLASFDEQEILSFIQSLEKLAAKMEKN